MKNKLLVLLVLIALGGLLMSCSDKATPAPTEIQSVPTMELPTDAVSLASAATSTPTTAPALTPKAPYLPRVPTYWQVADFETCFNMGGANPGNAPENFLEFACLPVHDSEGIVAQLDYETPDAWAAFWIKLNGADFSPYDTLTFFAKGDASQGIPPVFKIELKRQDNSQMGVVYLTGLTDQWKQFQVPLSEISPFPEMPELCGWDEMSEVVFTFESEKSGSKGRVFLDDIYVEQFAGGAPTPGPECAPTESPPPPDLLPGSIIADFDSCKEINNLGGPMGAAYNSPDNLTETYIPEAGRGCVARLAYQIDSWSAFWIKLQGSDLTPFSKLVFDIRADPQAQVPAQIKIELKRANNQEISIHYITNITNDWQTMSVNLAELTETGTTDPLSELIGMEELVFTFEANRSGSTGIIYLDNISLEP